MLIGDRSGSPPAPFRSSLFSMAKTVGVTVDWASVAGGTIEELGISTALPEITVGPACEFDFETSTAGV